MTAHQQVALDLDHISIDLDHFGRLIGNEDTTATALEDALDLWRGPFLDGLFLKAAPDFNRWVTRTREHLDQCHRQGYLALSQMAEDAGRWVKRWMPRCKP